MRRYDRNLYRNHCMILSNQRIKSLERYSIFYMHFFNIKFITARLVPLLLTLDDRRNRVSSSRKCLAKIHASLYRVCTTSKTSMECGSFTTHDRKRNSQSRVENSPRSLCRLTRPCRQYCGIYVISLTSITCKGFGVSSWADSTMIRGMKARDVADA